MLPLGFDPLASLALWAPDAWPHTSLSGREESRVPLGPELRQLHLLS